MSDGFTDSVLGPHPDSSAERREKAAPVERDKGHHFEITVRLRDDDAEDWADSSLLPQTVRAWNLHDALIQAAGLPLYQWFEPEDE